MARIPGFHPGGSGSIPGMGMEDISFRLDVCGEIVKGFGSQQRESYFDVGLCVVRKFLWAASR